jgi:glutamate-ammonia-ligase adenylyltransferase
MAFTSPSGPSVVPAPLAAACLAALAAADEDAALAALAALGFADGPRTHRTLLALVESLVTALPDPASREALLSTLLLAAAASPAPDAALVDLLRYAEARYGNAPGAATALAALAEPTLRLLARLFGYSQFCADLLIRYPNYLEWLEEDDTLAQPRTTAEYAALFAQALAPLRTPPRRRAAAIRAQRRELLRLGVRRMLGFSDELTLMRELSLLADSSIALALDETLPPLLAQWGTPHEVEDEPASPASTPPARFCVLALGKLGGGELNFSSDVDLLFLYSAEGHVLSSNLGTHRPLGNHQFFVKLSEALIEWLAAPDAEGSFYRVDTRLRPDGAAGPLARSLGACEVYYATQARPWEHVALLKARCVAGDAALGAAFLAMVRPLIFDPLRGRELITQMFEQKQRIDAYARERTGARGAPPQDLKRGPGGIREIEFLVQTRQVLTISAAGTGAHLPREIGSAATLPALQALCAAGQIAPTAARQLRAAYLLLRTLEHRLQMDQQLQTHLLPAADHENEWALLARRAGVAGATRAGAGARLRQRWQRNAHRVRQHFISFFYPTPRTELACDLAEAAARALLGAAPNAELLARVRPFGLTTPSAVKCLQRLAGSTGPWRGLHAQGSFGRLLPGLLRLLPLNPQPELALARFESLLQAGGATGLYFELFLQAPALFELLLLLLGTSAAFSQTICAHPEFIDQLLDFAAEFQPLAMADVAPETPAPALLFSTACLARRQQFSQAFLQTPDDEHAAARLAQYRHFEFLLTALGELGGLIDATQAAARLTAIADTALQLAFQRAVPAVLQPHLAVLAFGKFATFELNYFSDLDLLFVVEDAFAATDESSAATSDAAQRLIQLLSASTPAGRAFAVDTRLRPEGVSAPLVSTLGRFREYYRQRAQPWEFQAAMRLRPIAGALPLAHELCTQACLALHARAVEFDWPPLLREMRARIELGHKLPRWIAADLKTGPGGLVDLEFIAQFLQVRHVHSEPSLQGAAPSQVWHRAAQHAWLAPEQVTALSAHYHLLRQLERRLRLLTESEKSLLPGSGEKRVAFERLIASLFPPHTDSYHAIATTMQAVRLLFFEIIH